MHGENEPLQTLTFPLKMKRMLVIGEGQELHLVSLFPTKKRTIISVNTKARLAEAWEMTL